METLLKNELKRITRTTDDTSTKTSGDRKMAALIPEEGSCVRLNQYTNAHAGASISYSPGYAKLLKRHQMAA
jgi:hypothetical protein